MRFALNDHADASAKYIVSKREKIPLIKSFMGLRHDISFMSAGICTSS